MARDDDPLDDDVLAADDPRDRPLGVTEPVPDDKPVELFDETEDGLDIDEVSDIDADETGDEILGEAGEGTWEGTDTGPTLGPPRGALVSDRVPMAAEEAAVHVVDTEAEGDETE